MGEGDSRGTSEMKANRALGGPDKIGQVSSGWVLG